MPKENLSRPDGKEGPTAEWPHQVDLFGVQLTPTTYEEATDAILRAAQLGRPQAVSCFAVHALIESSRDPSLRERVNKFAMITPDGQPVRWALNMLHRTGLEERVCGPELMLRVCREAAVRQVPVYLYGSTQDTLWQLRKQLQAKFPKLQIAGAESPPFRALDEKEDDEMVARINESGAGIVFVGLGCPKQDVFAADHLGRINAVQLCVGAAFDFIAGTKKMAPAWMQRRGLEWLYRVCSEPRRLWRRYLVTNSIFLAKLAGAIVRPNGRRPTDRSAPPKEVNGLAKAPPGNGRNKATETSRPDGITVQTRHGGPSPALAAKNNDRKNVSAQPRNE